MIKVSVIMVTHNACETIEDSIMSFFSQTYPNKELIIVDGGSTDRTIEIIDRYRNNIITISEKDAGIYNAMNKGLKMTTGEIIGFLNSDDLYYDVDSLENIVDCFNHDVSMDATFSNLFYVNRHDPSIIQREWKGSNFNNYKLLFGWSPAHPTFYMKKLHYLKYTFNENYKISADYEFMLRLFKDKSLKFKYNDTVTVLMRSGGISNGKFTHVILKMIEDFEALKIISNFWILRIAIVALKNLRKIKQINFEIPKF